MFLLGAAKSSNTSEQTVSFFGLLGKLEGTKIVHELIIIDFSSFNMSLTTSVCSDFLEVLDSGKVVYTTLDNIYNIEKTSFCNITIKGFKEVEDSVYNYLGLDPFDMNKLAKSLGEDIYKSYRYYIDLASLMALGIAE